MAEIWSNTDFPYMCLRDEVRTLAFREAIRSVVNPGDVVVDIGAGTGIMSFFAIEAGASVVHAVEIDELMSGSLQRSVEKNGLADRVHVISGNAMDVEIPRNVDVVIAELIDTALLDEMQVAVLNSLRTRGVIGDRTRVIPDSYETSAELVWAENRYYGFEILAPKHDWPFYGVPESGWHPSRIETVSPRIQIARVDFTAERIETAVDIDLDFEVLTGRSANALRLSGRVGLSPGVELGPTNALNGDKVLAIEPVSGPSVRLRLRCEMSGGLAGLRVEDAPPLWKLTPEHSTCPPPAHSCSPRTRSLAPPVHQALPARQRNCRNRLARYSGGIDA